MKPTTAAGLVEANTLFFDSIAPDYDDWAGGLHRRVAARLVELVSPRPGLQALDVGCGTGLLTNSIARHLTATGLVIGLDASEGMLEQARRGALANTWFVRQSADHPLPFKDASFDLVTFSDSLGYLLDPELALQEASRVLRGGGQLGLAMPIHTLATVAQAEFVRILEELTATHPMVMPRPPHDRTRLGEKQVIAHLLSRSGFESIVTTTMVTGERMASAASWVSLMAGLAPRSHALLTTLGPAMRRQLETWVDTEMLKLGEEAFHYHEAFTFALASRSRP
ncbi:MAG TPA: methyltransferase domain-containing protein [Candidatus Acidoferrales bacterium]|nr:methyltransferase domain-containing protein [Candidatus Acidoferrales bacterium]